MTDTKVLKSTDFLKQTEVFKSGLENRDPQRGYVPPMPVEQTDISKMFVEKGVQRTPDLSNER